MERGKSIFEHIFRLVLLSILYLGKLKNTVFIKCSFGPTVHE